MMQKYLYSLFVLLFMGVNAQEQDRLVLNFKEYLGYVKKYHPIAKQAELKIDMGQANLMRSRGGFDPKIEVDYDRKEFKGTEYYDRLNAAFKIPTWYGLELKGNFEQNDGNYLNPSENVPDDGLYSAGVSMSVGQGFWINERMATLKQAKLLREQTKADRDLQVNQVLFEASLAYFQWLQAYQDSQILNDFFSSAQLRFEGVRTTALAGEIAAIDTVEAKIAVQDRALNLEQAKVRFVKSSLELSNFLWMGDNLPVELKPNVIPDVNLGQDIDATLEILGKPLDSFNLENHPKLKSMGYKIEGLTVEKRLKANKLLPKVDLEYNFLTTGPVTMNAFEPQDYKGGLSINLPLFLRKERGDLKLAKIKLEDAKFELDNAQIQIKNKIVAIFRELESFEKQNLLINDIVGNYNLLLTAEERKFSFGESSLFLVNSRESKLIDAELKQNEVRNKYYSAKAKLFNSLAVNPEKM
ncbi:MULTISPECIES: TolC family protein [Arenibacter]|uniref:Outer membrane efflux protein n=1 Tax=Arenibacter algicola TaxID=616991 RepID=A0A221UW73_9FLAO|nr:TolC family protein [Arenibacter algicola]ASO05629.1 outer membrane efflux protein [Arenibacter algicola]MDX1759477.1 TolC family protein [Arenibacter algicola]GBF20783.1 outer membrane efflux protein [Arenibacter sp. NBRC 103722]HCO83682.1 TolC family protein [Arenibacter sp.]|tara:strand:- start:96572 stop:97978 length:1407 start_codon:yes stop_codon:yes gene_type:complete